MEFRRRHVSIPRCLITVPDIRLVTLYQLFLGLTTDANGCVVCVPNHGATISPLLKSTKGWDLFNCDDTTFGHAMEVVKTHGLVSQVSHFSLLDSNPNETPQSGTLPAVQSTSTPHSSIESSFLMVSSCCFSGEVTILGLPRMNFKADCAPILGRSYPPPPLLRPKIDMESSWKCYEFPAGVV